MSNSPFLDSNVLIYAYSPDPRSAIAESLLYAGFVTGVQALNEFANVARRRLGMSWGEVGQAVNLIKRLSIDVSPTLFDDHRRSIALAERYQVSIYDALLLAVALRTESELFLSEDMHDGLMVEGRLTIRNPFVGLIF